MQINARDLKVGDIVIHAENHFGEAVSDKTIERITKSAGGAVVYAWFESIAPKDAADLILNHGDPLIIHRPTIRSYTVGAPMTVHVHEDGKVTYEVDLSEIHDIWESENDYDEAQIEADSATIDAATTAHYTANRSTTQEV
jgi:hypothetical protein